MKTAVVCYSLNGNCACVAEQIKAALNADVIQLHLADEKKRTGFALMLWGGGMVLRHKKPSLKPYDFDPAAYELIILGVPVWAGSPAPPMQTFLSQTPISGKKLALFACHAGGKGKALKKLKALLAGNDIISETDFTEPAKHNSDTLKQQINDWVKTLG